MESPSNCCMRLTFCQALILRETPLKLVSTNETMIFEVMRVFTEAYLKPVNHLRWSANCVILKWKTHFFNLKQKSNFSCGRSDVPIFKFENNEHSKLVFLSLTLKSICLLDLPCNPFNPTWYICTSWKCFLNSYIYIIILYIYYNIIYIL